MALTLRVAQIGMIGLGIIAQLAGCSPKIVEIDPSSPLYVGPVEVEEPPPSAIPAPFAPVALTCEIHPLGQSAGNTCTLTPSIPADPEGRAVTYVDGGSSCPSVSVNSTTGNVTFTAPAKATACVIAVKASNGQAFSPAVVSDTITGQNNLPATPSSVTCPLSPIAGTTGVACTLLAAVPSDLDGDTLAYLDNGSTCPAIVVNVATGSATFTAPAKGSTCVVKVRAYDGMDYSGAASSAIITGASQPPNTPGALSCATNPLAQSTGNACTLTAATPADNDGDSVTYSSDGSTCAAVVVNAGTGNATFTAPNKGSSCLVRVRAYDGASYSGTISSATITGTNNTPATPSALACVTTPLGGSTGNACTLTAATPADLDGDTVTYSNGGSTCTGLSVNSTTGSATFTAPGKGATCVVKVRAHDGSAYSSAVSSATITGQNNAPAQPASIACALTPLAGSAGNACTLTAASPVDIDGDSVTYSDDGSTCAAVSVNGTTGNATFTAPARGATCVVKVKANDGTANSVAVSSATITAQNNAPNQPASLSCPANPPAESTGNACSLTAASPVDSDGDTVTYVDDSSTCGAVVVTAATGAVTFTAPAIGQSCTIRVKAYDGVAYSTAVISSIGAGNNPPNQPAALTCPTTPLAQSTANTCTLTAATPTDNNGDTVTYSDNGSTCTVSVNSSTGNVTFTAPSKNATCVVKVRAHDGQAYSSAVSSSTITGQNNPPTTPTSLSCNTTPAGGSTGNSCTLTAASPVDKDNDPITYSDDGSTCISVVVNGTTGNATFTAPANGGTCVVKVRSHDGTAYSGTVSSATITAQSNPPNQPTSLSCATTPLAGNTLNSCTLTAASPADPDGQSVTYFNDASTCASVVVNSTTGNATFTAPAKNATCLVKVKAYDGALYSTAVSSATITGQNNAPNQPSAVSCTTNPVALSAGNACTLTAATPADSDGDSVTYSNDGSTCSAVSVNSGTGAATFTAPAKGATCVVKVRAHDGTEYSTTVSSATITGQNRAPNAPAALSCTTSPLGGSAGNTCTLTAASPVDPDGDSVTYSNDGSTCPAVSVNSGTGNATFTAPAKNATCVVKVRAHDGTAYSSAVTSATITGQNNAPNTPASLSCNTTPLGGSTANTCTLTAASPADIDGDSVSYSNNGSTCGAVSVTGATGAVSFTAPAKGAACDIKVRASDGVAYSGTVTSTTITGQNNPPRTPTSLVCPATPPPGSTGNTCTLTAASPADLDSDPVTYLNDGSTCAAASVSANGATITFTAPASGATCVMKVKAHDGTVYSSAISSGTITGTVAISCPANFIGVPGNATYGTSDFCVSKYPMKAVNSGGALLNSGDGAGTWTLLVNGCSGCGGAVYDCWDVDGHPVASTYAASRPDGTPWVHITRNEAAAKCSAMGAGYHLVTNAEWQTIARNIENVASNWSGGAVGSGMLNRGQSDDSVDVNAVAQGIIFENPKNSGWYSLASSATSVVNDSDGYIGTGNNSGQAPGSGWEQKRTHSLSNGETIWDLAGNVWQWVSDNNTTNFGGEIRISQLTDASHPIMGTIGSITGTAKLHFGPAGNFTTMNSGQFGGLGYANIDVSKGAILRGGSWLHSDSGVFTTSIEVSPTNLSGDWGFRCAK